MSNQKTTYHIVLFVLLFIGIATDTLFAQGTDPGSEPACHDDVNNTSFDMTGLGQEIDAVFTYRVGTFADNPADIRWFSCTGCMVNQRRADVDVLPIFMTATHCIREDGEVLNLGDLRFAFNFQMPPGTNQLPVTNGGGNGNVLARQQNHDVMPAQNDHQYFHQSPVRRIGTVGDFVLLRMLNPPPPHFDLYYAGWKSTPEYLPSIVPLTFGLPPFRGIHHPGQDLKKASLAVPPISSIPSPLQSGCAIVGTVINGIVNTISGIFNGPTINALQPCSFLGSPYLFIPTYTDGGTEGGSSGSPMFNSNGRVLGALSGGPDLEGPPFNFPVGCAFQNDFYWTFSNAYHGNNDIRLALNPSGNINYAGMSGRRIQCYDRIEYNDGLNWGFYPFTDHQVSNHLHLRAEDEIILGEDNGDTQITILPNSEYTFTAQSVTLKPGTSILAGSNVTIRASDNPCGTAKFDDLPAIEPPPQLPNDWEAYLDSVGVSPATLDSILELQADYLCLSRPQLDSLLDNNVSQMIIATINNCFGNASSKTDQLTSVEVEGTEDDIGFNSLLVQIYPNPTNGKFTIRSTSDATFELYDYTGKSVYEQVILTGDNTMNVESLSSGVYQAHIRNTQHTLYKRLIIRR